ncbi:MAG: DnaJ C-terminal domain-containing protein, partial [Actinomycetota bacterium]
FGTRKDVEIYAGAPCDPCGGSGLEPGSGRVRCQACSGTGEIRHVQRSVFGQMMTARPCGRCGGSGQVPEQPCRTCGGDGRLMRQTRVTVEIPAGVEHGTTLRIRGRGEAGARGGEAGDLYVHIGVEPDSVFKREGEDLVCRLGVPVTQAILGGSVVVPTLDGEETIAIEAGTQPGAVLRVRGRGVPRLGGRGRGDLIVALDIEIPKRLSAEERELVRKFGELRGDPALGAPPKGRKRGIKDVLRGT